MKVARVRRAGSRERLRSLGREGGGVNTVRSRTSLCFLTHYTGRDDLSRGFVFGAVRLPTPMAAEVRVRVGVRAPKRPSAAFLLRAGAKLAENDGKTFSNFSRCAKIEAPTRGLPFRAQSSRFRAPRRVKKITLKKTLYRGDGVHMALTQPLSVVEPRGSLSYPTDQRPSLVPAKTAGK